MVYSFKRGGAVKAVERHASLIGHTAIFCSNTCIPRLCRSAATGCLPTDRSFALLQSQNYVLGMFSEYHDPYRMTTLYVSTMA